MSTLALDPHELTAALGHSPFSAVEREAQWHFWRAVAVGQHLRDIPPSHQELRAWAAVYEDDEYAASEEGRQITAALIEGFGQRCLPAPLRRLDRQIIATLCPPRLRQVHGLPEPGVAVRTAVRLALAIYVRTLPLHPVPLDRSLVVDFGDNPYGPRSPDDVGYQRPAPT